MFLGVVAAVARCPRSSAAPRSSGPSPQPILAILGATLLIVVVGVADDLWDLDWMIKLAAQFLAAGLVAWRACRSTRCRSAG